MHLIKSAGIPPVLLPLLRAYILGYISYVSPRLFSIIAKLGKARINGIKREDITFQHVLDMLKKGFDPQQFPTFCGIVGGWHLLYKPIEAVLLRISRAKSSRARVDRLTTFLASAISATLGITLLNSCRRKDGKAGRTLALTLFAVVRALDVLIGEAWTKRRAQRIQNGKWSGAEQRIGGLTDTFAFTTSVASIMYSWVYAPEKLPREYNKWITEFADIDLRLLETLRRIKDGRFIYGKNTGQAPLLGEYCKELNLPEVLGDPEHTVPIPCQIVHGGWTKSCELNAAFRFWKAWKAAFSMYLGLNLLVRLKNPSFKSLISALTSAVRSSAFLGAFVSSLWYAVCLTRTRLGPFLFPKTEPIVWDNQLLIKAGCLLCGWSILIEPSRRRPELSAFVAPRALATLLPCEYDEKYLWKEYLVFAISTATVMSASQVKPELVRGVLGRVLGRVMAT